MATFEDRFGNMVQEGDIVIWTPSEGNGLALRRVLSITAEDRTNAYGRSKGQTYVVLHVKVCPPGHESTPSTHRVINHGNAVRWPDQGAQTDRG